MDRTDAVQTRTNNPRNSRATPMPGHLPVEQYSDLLKSRITVDLSDVVGGEFVLATGRITRVRHLDPGAASRVNVVLTADDGNSAIVTFAPGRAAVFETLLHQGTPVTVAGLVSRRLPSLPAGIDGSSVRLAVIAPVADQVAA